MSRNKSPRGWVSLVYNGLQLLFWIAFILIVIVGVKAPSWVKYVGWVLAAFYVVRAALGILRNRK